MEYQGTYEVIISDLIPVYNTIGIKSKRKLSKGQIFTIKETLDDGSVVILLDGKHKGQVLKKYDLENNESAFKLSNIQYE